MARTAARAAAPPARRRARSTPRSSDAFVKAEVIGWERAGRRRRLRRRPATGACCGSRAATTSSGRRRGPHQDVAHRTLTRVAAMSAPRADRRSAGRDLRLQPAGGRRPCGGRAGERRRGRRAAGGGDRRRGDRRRCPGTASTAASRPIWSTIAPTSARSASSAAAGCWRWARRAASARSRGRVLRLSRRLLRARDGAELLRRPARPLRPGLRSRLAPSVLAAWRGAAPGSSWSTGASTRRRSARGSRRRPRCGRSRGSPTSWA